MKKLMLGVGMGAIMLGAAAAAAYPYHRGGVLERAASRWIDVANAVPEVPFGLTLEGYERGWLTSEARTRVVIPPSEVTEKMRRTLTPGASGSVVVHFSHEIEHGFTETVVRSRLEPEEFSEALLEFAASGANPFEAVTRLRADEVESVITVRPFKGVLEADGDTRHAFSGAQAWFRWGAVRERIEGTLAWSGWEAWEADGGDDRVAVPGLHGSLEIEREGSGVWTGEAEVGASFTVHDARERFTVENARVRAAVESSGGDLFRHEVTVAVDRLAHLSEGVDLVDSGLTVSLERVPLASLEALAAIREGARYGREPGIQEWAALLDPLFASGPVLEARNAAMLANTAGGGEPAGITTEARLVVDKGTQVPVAAILGSSNVARALGAALREHSVVRIEARIDREGLRALPSKVGESVEKMQRDWDVFVIDEEAARVVAEVDHGVMRLNGRERPPGRP